NYRSVIKNTLSFDPEVLKRYVNFVNNPDERTAVDQFGKGDKYFGVCTLMATLPGLPMFGHGQIEGYTERYGMEYRRAYHEEEPDPWLVARHEREISPLLHRRHLFAEARSFLLYDFFTEHGHVNEDVFAYSNRSGDERALVVFNNRYSSTRGWVRISCAFAEKTAHGKHLRQSTLGESFGFRHTSPAFAAYRDALSGLEYIHRTRDLAERGMRVDLHAYQTHVFLDWRDLHEDAAHPWGQLCDSLAGRGVPSLEEALKALLLRPVHDAVRSVLDPGLVETLSSPPAALLGGETNEGVRVLETARHRAALLLAEVDRYVAGAGSESSDAAERVRAQELFRKRIEAALRLDVTCRKAARNWPLAARGMPVFAANREDGDRGPGAHSVETKAAWTAVLGWCAIEAVGVMRDAENPDAAAAWLFESLRLREPLAAAFAGQGLGEDENWRAAARLRASFAHSSRTATGGSWIQDPDVAWVIGVHQHEGVTYLVQEHLERLLWWMALRDLLEIGGAPQLDLGRLSLIEEEISARMEATKRAGYRVEALDATTLLAGFGEHEEKLQKRP